MKERPNWQWDEYKHAGTDFGDPAEVSKYEARHLSFRNIPTENANIMNCIGLEKTHTVIDMGAGTGFFAIEAARHCGKVHMVDVSEAMLDYARKKAKKEGLINIEFHHGGFLTYEHEGEPADAAVSAAALHHLPDFWKYVGLKRLANSMKPGGKLFLMDVIFSFAPTEYAQALGGHIKATAESMGQEFADGFIGHFRDEFSTFDWVMEGLLDRAGFRIDSSNYYNSVVAYYVCTKAGE